MSEIYIGLMSGTSADGIDAVALEWNEGKIRILGHLEHSYAPELRQDIVELCQPGPNEVQRLGQLDHRLGLAFADTALKLIETLRLKPSEITAIGSHGQTVRHQPPGSLDFPFTLQIGDPNIIAERTGITTVSDFRRRDMAVGGQGAPLAPAFHQAAFGNSSEVRVIVNLGGIANITVLRPGHDTLGFDTGPANVLLDSWIQRHRSLPYDKDGHWASTGIFQSELLEILLQHSYFRKDPPKSTGREDFHLDWLDQQLEILPPLKPADVQATLVELTAISVSRDIEDHAHDCKAIYLCGGGANNPLLREGIEQHSGIGTYTTTELGIDPQQVEGAAFAWLAHQALQRLPGNSPSTTGADKAVILGGIYPA